MYMTQNERKILQRLMVACNNLGGILDLTATCTLKLYDRQRGLSLVSNVLYGILAQHPDNEYNKEDIDNAIDSLNKLEKLVEKEYPDKNGYI